MDSRTWRARRSRWAPTHVAAAAFAILGAGAFGCLDRPIEAIQPLTTSVVVEQVAQQTVNKIDLLLAVDNSSSMADKQQILALAVPDLVNGLVNPQCVDSSGKPVAAQPASLTDPCPAMSQREFPPVLDIHIGLVSSSLGTFGAPATGCGETPVAPCAATSDTTPGDDHGHLVTRTDNCDTGGPVPTFQNEGFLAWNPTTGAPSGSISSIGSASTGGLVGLVTELVIGNGQSGCGFESQNESWYRFLADPTPYASITSKNGVNATSSGTDMALLKQRAEFLRPDSLLAIILLSDETDTSIKESGDYPIVGDTAQHMALPSSACAKDPTDPCCYSCFFPVPKACTTGADPICAGTPLYTDAQENPALRAFGLMTHKQRYGIEFFYPPSRYVNALTNNTIPDATGAMVQNPIFAGGRSPSLVFYAAVVGVPWQLIARKNAAGQPDLVNGISDMSSSQVGGFKTAEELDESDGTGATYWDDVAGDPEHYVPARSPFMVESTVARTGKDPITGVSTFPVGTTNGQGAKAGVTSQSNGQPALMNDHEWTVPTPASDIEYACIFPLATPRDESAGGVVGDCTSNPTDNPLCSLNPADGKHTLQTSAKAYPGVKHLAIAKGMKGQGIAASICPAQLSDSTQADYGYRPAVKTIIDRLKLALRNECLPRQLTESTVAGPQKGSVPCLVLEATKVDSASQCACDGTARQAVPPEQQPAVAEAEQNATASTEGLNCFCEIKQLTGSDLVSCQEDPSSTANGWCYVDASVDDKQAALLPQIAQCPAASPHTLRFVGAGNAVANSTLFITCSGD